MTNQLQNDLDKFISKLGIRMADQILVNVEQNPYLGVQFTNTLKWDTHINNILAKANKSLGFLRRNISKFPEEIKKRAYIKQ